jgi:hypothetical protein
MRSPAEADDCSAKWGTGAAVQASRIYFVQQLHTNVLQQTPLEAKTHCHRRIKASFEQI